MTLLYVWFCYKLSATPHPFYYRQNNNDKPPPLNTDFCFKNRTIELKTLFGEFSNLHNQNYTKALYTKMYINNIGTIRKMS